MQASFLMNRVPTYYRPAYATSTRLRPRLLLRAELLPGQRRRPDHVAVEDLYAYHCRLVFVVHADDHGSPGGEVFVMQDADSLTGVEPGLFRHADTISAADPPAPPKRKIILR